MKSGDNPQDDDARWLAVLTRDKAADGGFIYAVKTTGVYCSPSCASRRPKRENVLFFASADQAQAAGFRPCKRCRQGRLSREAQQAEQITRACRMIEQIAKPPALHALAQAVGLSPFHFHRLFKAITGVTPRQYANAHRQRQVRQQLAKNDAVTAVILDNGYSAAGRFYAASDAQLGMTPKTFQHKGRGMTIYFAVGACSLGDILVAESERGICAILLGEDPQQLVEELQEMFANAQLVGGDAAFERRVAQVVGFVDAPEIGLALPLDIRGTAFQQRVWQALRDIPIGETASYSDIAARIGSPAAVRAVAGACAANRLAVAIPCHRVVRHDGSLSGYRWGVARKSALLNKEALAKAAGEPARHES
ncbi:MULTISPECIES: bifunctional DNA-binding transcriptional regulator/O6-methylguanine-DNA methyltransferase Ada [Brenneria]|uniref:Bifunctional DNA-binding transcriptional regulator/O6-methylguanine-DNA methyltransferase Ada n=1 Tax=Brenneria nigrifluens DSM 30175 = ATCC 13028 TaxID=1121120 RepID=A0A2U1UEN4_9GAMM|nr:MULTISPECIES: bifunctional DNA-binding transcriptional regulator/O6-methylguanine-DNA methyltransferase Ada [Brenneria]EHD23001.1 Ada DNA repair protein and transcriptional regulator, AraC family [Brenneria sp. EniD312]PWC20136.1 bifunctional DNA-binding transcriptional regulator/O6-methylguanine-DNA methyltransferase Ada [Brenneria nigrifluens DSM 30175 = ATCC 13028]QCR05900.1 bifunctional DNA-binding transcriptional regulator/O6-methylguanine-DNA methyltransferase Ada [Brenneria nigrifluens